MGVRRADAFQSALPVSASRDVQDRRASVIDDPNDAQAFKPFRKLPIPMNALPERPSPSVDVRRVDAFRSVLPVSASRDVQDRRASVIDDPNNAQALKLLRKQPIPGNALPERTAPSVGVRRADAFRSALPVSASRDVQDRRAPLIDDPNDVLALKLLRKQPIPGNALPERSSPCVGVHRADAFRSALPVSASRDVQDHRASIIDDPNDAQALKLLRKQPIPGNALPERSSPCVGVRRADAFRSALPVSASRDVQDRRAPIIDDPNDAQALKLLRKQPIPERTVR